MDTGLLVSFILGASSIVSSLITSIFFGWIPNRRSQKIQKLKSKVVTLIKDVASFREIESAYISLLSEKTGENREGLKNRIRKQVREKMGYSLSDNTQPCKIKNALENLKQN